VPGATEEYIAKERREQFAEIARRQKLFRDVRPAASIAGRSIIVTDDGIATGSTMIAALRTLRGQKPHELIVAAPVASPDRLEAIRDLCDDVVCLRAPPDFMAVGQYYRNFDAVEDEEVLGLLREFAPASPARARTKSA
jgi:predicted phosphoribosyltransferase